MPRKIATFVVFSHRSGVHNAALPRFVSIPTVLKTIAKVISKSLLSNFDTTFWFLFNVV